MKPHDFWVIGTTVVVTLVVTTILNWLFRIIDVVVPFSKTPEKVRSILSREANVSLFWFSVLLLIDAFTIVQFALDKNPITRLSVLYAATVITCTLIFSLAWMFQLQVVLRERRREKMKRSEINAEP